MILAIGLGAAIGFWIGWQLASRDLTKRDVKVLVSVDSREENGRWYMVLTNGEQKLPISMDSFRQANQMATEIAILIDCDVEIVDMDFEPE